MPKLPNLATIRKEAGKSEPSLRDDRWYSALSGGFSQGRLPANRDASDRDEPPSVLAMTPNSHAKADIPDPGLPMVMMGFIASG